jgi:hypothetical protein
VRVLLSSNFFKPSTLSCEPVVVALVVTAAEAIEDEQTKREIVQIGINNLVSTMFDTTTPGFGFLGLEAPED